MRTNKGFTLIELLVAVSIIITSATVVVAVITSTFRDSNKVSNQEQIRIAGDNALNQVVAIVQYADSFDGASSNGRQISCDSTLGDTEADELDVTTDQEQHFISCSNEGISLDGNPLINGDKFNTDSCNITCTQLTNADSPLINITFDLSTAQSTSSNLPEVNSQINNFSRTIKMKNVLKRY